MFFKQIFTWWNKQTLGTFLYTLLKGKFIGTDSFGNKYYQSKRGKRWVIYKEEVEATKVPPEWFSWLHNLEKNKPKVERKTFFWQTKHVENLTGTDKAHKPKGSIFSEKKDLNKKYDSWSP